MDRMLKTLYNERRIMWILLRLDRYDDYTVDNL